MNALFSYFNKERFSLFTPVNPKSIILFRICVALMLAYMFAPRGLFPLYPLTEFPSIHDAIFSDTYYVLIYILIALFAIGIQSRIIAILLFIALLPHDFLSNGRASKQVILCVLLCFAFIKTLPIWKIKQRHFLPSEMSPIWPIRLIQIQLSLLYGANALAKTSYDYLSGNTLIEMSKTFGNFHVDLSDGFLYILDIPIPAYLLAISSVCVEYFLSIGFWFKKTKWIAISVGLLFHFCLTFVLTIYMLDYVSIFLYLAFIIPLKLKK